MAADLLRVLFVNPENFDYLHAALVEGMADAPDLRLATWSIGSHGERGFPCYRGDIERAIRDMGAFDVLMVGTTGRAGLIPDDARRLIVSSAERHPGQVRALVDSGDLASAQSRSPNLEAERRCAVQTRVVPADEQCR